MNDATQTNQPTENELMFWTFAFSDLNKILERIPKEKRDNYYKKLFYYDRDYYEIRKEILRAASYSHNIIIQGLAGSGKTTLVKRYIIDDEFLKHNYIPLYVSTLNSNKVLGYISSFIKKILQYIESVKYSITVPAEMKPENLTDVKNAIIALNHLRELVSKLDIPSRDKRPLIFLDDLDYAEHDWKEITNALRDFVADGNIVFVFTLRPRLESIILSDPDDRIRYLYHNTEKVIMIIPNILNIILNRIYLIIHPEKDKDVDDYSGYYNIINRVRDFLNRSGLRRRRSAYLSLLQDLGVENVEELFNAQINFPFQESYLEFMNKITDSNLRRIFLIAHATIIAMKKDKINLETNKNGVWEINKDSISKLFIENAKSNWFFLNINQERIKNNVSLFYAILHILHNEPGDKISGKKSYNIIKNKVKGISKEKIVQACETLSSKEWALIDYIGFYDDEMEYKLNRKGLYYLEVANWEQYIKEYGNHNYIFRKN